jgi:hypothetical protein
MTAAYFHYETKIYWPTFSWQDFEYSSLYWPIIIRPVWMNAGIAIHLTITFFGLVTIL